MKRISAVNKAFVGVKANGPSSEPRTVTARVIIFLCFFCDTLQKLLLRAFVQRTLSDVISLQKCFAFAKVFCLMVCNAVRSSVCEISGLKQGKMWKNGAPCGQSYSVSAVCAYIPT